ncbi:MAG: imidazole glycerol phosphate synthase subunit HisH [Alphaproteobacteria bacterium]|nr:imidazole glycerol phosphate synthase subunit HisH [Alphaproteobacteria bacterium]
MIAVVDSGICNMFSLLNAFRAVERPASAAATPDQVMAADRIVLPGVGAFTAGMKSLRQRGLDEAIREQAAKGVPILGICLGMQLLAAEGREGGATAGLGLVNGRVTLLDPRDPSLLVPHIGWNNFTGLGDNRLLRAAQLGDKPDFYFVHSYRLETDDPAVAVAEVDYGHPFVGAFDAGQVFGCQFHPELSHHNGLKVLRAFVDLEC